MSPNAVATVFFICVFGAALAGMLLQNFLPAEHLSSDSKRVVDLGMGLIATMTALILGLVTASAKTAFDVQDTAVRHNALQFLQLDRVLAQYGPEAAGLRPSLERLARYRLAVTWPEDVASTEPVRVDAPDITATVEDIAGGLTRLAPKNDAQRYLQNRALDMSSELQESRWQLLGSRASSVPTPFLVIVACWLSLIFATFGLFAPRNGTVICVLLVSALSIAASLFLILEMDDAFHGIIKVSSEPVRYTIERLGK